MKRRRLQLYSLAPWRLGDFALSVEKGNARALTQRRLGAKAQRIFRNEKNLSVPFA
jgi:hypothetical protein